MFVRFNGGSDILGGAGVGSNLRLQPGSPCSDAADNTSVPADVTTDLDNAPRFVDDVGTPDTGLGDPPIVDMGPYEYQITCPLGNVLT